MPRVSQFPEETPIVDLDRRLATLEGIIRQRFLEGSESIGDGNSTEVVSHGLGRIPSSVFVGPGENERLWITAIGSTTFTVNRVGTSGGHTFSWLAIP